MRRPIRGALRRAHERVGDLTITHPDPDAYDKGFNDAIVRACKEIEQVFDEITELREDRRTPAEKPRIRARDTFVLEVIRRHAPMEPSRIASMLGYKSHRDITGAIRRLTLNGLIRQNGDKLEAP